MTGFNSEFDSDRNLTIPGTASVINLSSNSSMILASNTGLKPIDVVLDWSEYSLDMLRTRPSHVLQPVSQQNMFDVSFNEDPKNIDSEGEPMIEGK